MSDKRANFQVVRNYQSGGWQAVGFHRPSEIYFHHFFLHSFSLPAIRFFTHAVTTNRLLFSFGFNRRFEDWNSVVPIFHLDLGPIDRLVKVLHVAPIPPFEAIETARFRSPLTVISMVVVRAVYVVWTPNAEGNKRARTSAEDVATFYSEDCIFAIWLYSACWILSNR